MNKQGYVSPRQKRDMGSRNAVKSSKIFQHTSLLYNFEEITTSRLRAIYLLYLSSQISRFFDIWTYFSRANDSLNLIPLTSEVWKYSGNPRLRFSIIVTINGNTFCFAFARFWFFVHWPRVTLLISKWVINNWVCYVFE